MDEISAAISAALNAMAGGAISGMRDAAKKGVADAYGALKGALQKKLGADSPVTEAVKQLKENPKSATHRQSLQKEIQTAKVTDDSELIRLARALLQTLKDTPEIHANKIGVVQKGGEMHINTINL